MLIKQLALVRYLRGIISLISVLFLLAGCVVRPGATIKTSIMSEPEGAKIYVNEEYVGLSPVYYEFFDGLWKENLYIIAKKEGFKTTQQIFEDTGGGSFMGSFSDIDPT